MAAKPSISFDWAVGLASVLVGLAAGWQLLGACTIFRAEIDPLPATTTMVTVVALLWVAVGLLVPARVVALVHHSAGPHATGQVALSWLGLALLSATTALSCLVAIAMSRPMLGAYRWALDQFFWTNLTLAGLEWLLVAAILCLPCVALGLATSVVVSCARHSGENRGGLALVSSGLLLGTALAVSVILLPGWRIDAEQQVVVGTLPLFALAGGALWISSKTGREASLQPDPKAPVHPASFAAEGLARLTPMIWAFGLALALTGWTSCRPETQTWPGGIMPLLLGFIALSHAGFSCLWNYLGCLPGPATPIWLCGLGSGLAAGLAARSSESAWALGLELALIAVPAGQELYAMSRLGHGRTLRQAVGLADAGVMVLTGTALGLAAARWWGLPQLGALGTLAAGSLVLLGLGGLLELHGQVRPGRSEHLQLALVFASLAAAIVAFPAFTRTWTRRDHQRFAPMQADVGEALGKELAAARTACLIGINEAAVDRLPEGRTTLVQLLPLMSWLPGRSRQPGDDRVHPISMPATRALRLSRARYQLVYQALTPGRDDLGVYCSAEWLSQLHRHVAPGGTLMIELPLAGLGRLPVRDLVATFGHTSPGRCSWMLIGGSRPTLLLRSGPDSAADRKEIDYWHHLESLIGEGSEPRLCSIRRPWTGSSWAPHAGDSALEWLASRVSSGGPVARGATPTGLPR